MGIFLNEFYKAQNKKLFSFVLESNVIETRLFYNTSLKNKNAVSENKTRLDLIAYIQRKYPNKVFIIDLSKNSNNLGWYEKDSRLFDGDISILKSEGYFIHEPINIYDGLIIFPEIRS